MENAKVGRYSFGKLHLGVKRRKCSNWFLKMNSVLENHVITDESQENHGSSSKQIHKSTDEKLHCGLNADSDSFKRKNESLLNMLLWLKCVALEPNTSNRSSGNYKEPWSQILNVRKVLNLSYEESPWRKRKLNKLLQETGPTASLLHVFNSVDSEGSSDQVNNPQSPMRSLNFVDNLSQKRIPNGHSNLVLDSDDSVSGSILLSSKKRLNQISANRQIKLFKPGKNDSRKQIRIGPYKEVSLLYKPHEVSNSLSSKSEREYTTEKPVIFDFVNDDIPQMAIPVGPRFQAEIPDIIGVPNRVRGDANAENSDRWLGTRIWPIESLNRDSSREVIGKGRPSSCSCPSPGSTQCIKIHVAEKRFQLKNDLSSVFFSWEFDKMGEEVSKSWAPIEEERFMNLVKANPVSQDLSFWKPALKCFPSKPRESLVSYYFNVCVLRRMSRQIRLSPIVDSDDDEAYDGVAQSKNLKRRYLTGIR